MLDYLHDTIFFSIKQQVSLANISNNWNVPNKDAEIILEKWLKNYSDDRAIVKEYLIRGADSNGNSIITVS